MPAATGQQWRIRSVADAVKTVAAECDGPTLITLTASGTTVTGRRETLPGGPVTADAMPAALAGLARLIARHRAMFPADVAGYAVILPGERVALAVTRRGTTHVQLPGVPTEPIRHDRWDAMIDALTAMRDATTR